MQARRTKSERRQQIAEATLELVGRYGVQGTTVSRIAAATGLSRSALYKHFPSRDAVLRAAMDVMATRPSRWANQASGEDGLSRLVDMGDRHADWALSEFDSFIRPLFEFMAGGAQGNLSEGLRAGQLKILENFTALANEGKRDGSIDPHADSTDIAWALLMFAWAEDVARLLNVEEFMTSGASRRILRQVLSAAETHPDA